MHNDDSLGESDGLQSLQKFKGFLKFSSGWNKKGRGSDVPSK